MKCISFIMPMLKCKFINHFSFMFSVRRSLVQSRENKGFPVCSVVRNLPANAGEAEMGSIPGSGKIPWRRKWQPTPVFLPGGLQSMGSQKDQT